jgi:hypothetical protein
MHRGPGTGSVSQAAADYGRQQGIAVIDGGCPCMFGPRADFWHKAMRVFFSLNGNVPREQSSSVTCTTPQPNPSNRRLFRG